MATLGWFWPSGSTAARGIAIAPFGSGMAIADWTAPRIWPFSGSAFSAGITLATGTSGLVDIAQDTTTGVWALSWDGNLWHKPFIGAATLTQMPSGKVYVGCTASGVTLAADGTAYTSAAVQVGVWPTHAWFLSSTGTTLTSLLPASGVGTMNSGTGATGLIAFPASIPTPSCIAMTGNPSVGIAGWQPAPALSGAAAAAPDPQDPTAVMTVGSGRALLWRAPSVVSEQWTQTQTFTGLVNLSAMGWTPNGIQVLAPSVTSGVVQVIGYSAGVMSLLQSLSISGACSVAVAGDSAHALVAQSGQSQLATLTYGGATWATGTAVTGLPGIIGVVPVGTSGAAAAYSGGLAFLNLVAGIWSVYSTVPTVFVPRSIAVDSLLQVYTAGSGAFAVTSGSTLLGSGALPGAAPTAIAVQQGRVVLAVPTDNALYVYGQSSPGVWTQQYSGALALGTTVGLALANSTLFALGSGATTTYGFSGTPYVLTPIVSGGAAIRIGAAWTEIPLGIGNTPSACAFDASGSLWVTTTQNMLWTISSGGTVLASAAVTPYSGQSVGTPLGLSALLASGGSMYATTSLGGGLVQNT